MKFDLVIKGGIIVDPVNRLEDRMDIGILDDRIADLKPEITRAENVLQVSGVTVIPGVIDMHVYADSLVCNELECGPHGSGYASVVILN